MNQQANHNRAEHNVGENQTFSPDESPLIGQIQVLARRLQRLVWLRSIAESIFLVVVCLVVGVLLDWWFRPVHWAGRFAITTVTFLGVASAIALAFRRLNRQRITPLAVARRIEAIHPGLGDRMSSAVALESHAAANAPSDLAIAVIRTASAALQQVDPAKQIDRGPAFRSTVLALAALLVGLLWIFGNPLASTLAAKRLIAPVGETKWPQQNHLRLENVPTGVFLGDDVEIFVSDASGTIPADTEIQFRLADDSLLVPPLRMHGNRGAAILQNVQSRFEVRARGGDDDSLGWYAVEVTAAPRLVDYRVVLVPPEYSQREPLETQDTELQLLAGTELSISATVRPAVSQAKLVSSPLGRSDAIAEWDVQVDATGAFLVVDPIVLTTSQSLRFVWKDKSGLPGQSVEQWKITVTQDALPTVTLSEPAVDLEIVPDGMVELAGEVMDDLGLVDRWVEVRQLNSSRRTRVAQQSFDGQPLIETWQFTLDLPSLTFAGEGDTLEVLAVAIDNAGQRGESTTRRLRIISDSMLTEAMAKRDREILESLQAATRQQETALEQTDAARSRLGDSTEQRQAASDRIRSAEAAQRNAQSRLTEGTRSARQELENAMSAAKNNRREDPHLQEAKARLEDIADRAMAAAEESLREANRQWASDERSSQVREATEQALQQARDAQQESLDQLNRWVAELRQADAQRAAVEELTDLVAQQERLAEATAALPTASDQAQETDRLSARQRELARNAEGMPTRLRELAATVADLQPVFAARAEQAAKILEQGGAVGEAEARGGAIDAMRQAAEELQRGRSGRVEGLQQQARKELDNARRALQGLKGTREQQATDIAESNESDDITKLQSLYTKQLSINESLASQQWTGLSELELANAQAAAQAAREFSGAPGFRDAIEDTVVDMQMAAALLARAGRESEAEEPAANALERLRIIVESLQDAGQEDGANGELPNESTTDKNPTDPSDDRQQASTIPLASLRLVRSTQEFLLRRTADLKSKEVALDEDSSQGSQRRPQLQAAKRRLAEEQASLVQRIELYAQEIMSAQNSATATPEKQP